MKVRTMIEFMATIKQVGGSLMVRIPKGLAEQERLREGDEVDLRVKKAKKSYLGAFPGLKPFTKADRMRFRYE